MLAVEVPSPALSWVLLATSCTSLAPMFAKGSAREMSLAMVTPSFMMVGLPQLFSRTTVLAAGPSVTLTAFATESIPSSSFLRASSPYNICFAIHFNSFCSKVQYLRLKIFGFD